MRLPLALLASASLAAAQQQPKPQPPGEELAAIKVDVDLVNILCSVRDKRGGLIGSLTKDDFTLYEDGKQQTIKYFVKETDLPLTIGLLIDVSVSQGRLIEDERRAGLQFFSQVLRKKDMAFLIGFGAESELLQDYTNSKTLLREGLDRLRVDAQMTGLHPGPVPTAVRPHGTVMFDAVYLAANERLQKEVGRKAMVLITDGVDQGSRTSRQGGIDAALRADAIIYSIEYVDPGFYYGHGMAPSNSDLKRLSEETGGRLLRVDRKHNLQDVFDEIQADMRSQYALAYTSTNAGKHGEFRKIEIKTREKDQKVQARKGYFATASTQSEPRP
jgi:VWFA-related protein